MQPNPNYTNPPTVTRNPQSKFYDPSEPYRNLLMPANNPNSNAPQDAPPTNIDPKTGVVKRIPQFYYPRDDIPNNPPLNRPNVSDPARMNPNVLPVQPLMQQPILPYSQPMIIADPYASSPYYPYSAPYVVPLTTTVPVQEPIPHYPEQSKNDVIAAHQKDADLSRLEVYHFVPKQDSNLSRATAASQPIIQYHVYPYPPGGAPTTVPPPMMPPPPLPMQPLQPQYSQQPYPRYSQPPNAPYYAPEFPPPNGPYYAPELPPSHAETKARSSQTEPATTKNRGVSPIHFTSIAAPPYDDDGYPYIHQRQVHTDRNYVPTGRIDRRFYDAHRSSALPDCRCLDCQQERLKVLNYYPD